MTYISLVGFHRNTSIIYFSHVSLELGHSPLHVVPQKNVNS